MATVTLRGLKCCIDFMRAAKILFHSWNQLSDCKLMQRYTSEDVVDTSKSRGGILSTCRMMI